jgi:hypothetical protein
VDLYNVVREWEVRERERDLCPRPITATTHVLLRNVGVIKKFDPPFNLLGWPSISLCRLEVPFF